MGGRSAVSKGVVFRALRTPKNQSSAFILKPYAETSCQNPRTDHPTSGNPVQPLPYLCLLQHNGFRGSPCARALQEEGQGILFRLWASSQACSSQETKHRDPRTGSQHLQIAVHITHRESAQSRLLARLYICQQQQHASHLCSPPALPYLRMTVHTILRAAQKHNRVKRAPFPRAFRPCLYLCT